MIFWNSYSLSAPMISCLSDLRLAPIVLIELMPLPSSDMDFMFTKDRHLDTEAFSYLITFQE